MDGLIIKKRWLDLILSGVKRAEIRGHIPHSHKGVEIALIESGSGMIKGTTTIHSVTRCWQDGWFEKTQKFHQIPIEEINMVKYKKIYAWWMTKPTVFVKPIPYIHKKGAVIWVKDVL